MFTGTAAADASSLGLRSFFILRRRGVEQHGRPTVRTMIWTNNPLNESGRCLCFTETAARFIIFDYFLSRGAPGKTLLRPTFSDYDPDYKVPGKSRQYHAVSGSIRQTQITKNPRNIDFPSTFRGYFLVRGRGFEPPRINHTHLKRARLPVPPPSHILFAQPCGHLRWEAVCADCLNIVPHLPEIVKRFSAFS